MALNTDDSLPAWREQLSSCLAEEACGMHRPSSQLGPTKHGNKKGPLMAVEAARPTMWRCHVACR